LPGEKRPAVTNWQNAPITARTVTRWADAHPGASVGLRLGEIVDGVAEPGVFRLVALDVDSMHGGVAEHLRGRLLAEYPGAAIRVGRPPKFLSLFLIRSEEPFRKQKSARYIDYLDTPFHWEILGSGQQCVVGGVHPETGRPYEWDGGGPLSTPAASLPIIRDGWLDRFGGDFEAFAESLGAVRLGASSRAMDGDPDNAFDTDRGALENYTLEQARADLAMLPAATGYYAEHDNWYPIGMGLYHQFDGAAEALDLWDDWSSGCPSYPGTEALRRRWASFDAGDYAGDPRTVRTMIRDANKARRDRNRADAGGGAERLSQEALRERLANDANGVALRNILNISAILRLDEGLPEIWQNDMLDVTMYGVRPIRDADVAAIRYRMSDMFSMEPSIDKVQTAVAVVAQENARHPVVEYLDGLQWDGKPRLQRWLSDYLGAEDSEWVREVATKTLVAAVARAYRPGTKWDYLIILEGPQGALKSSAVHALSPEDSWVVDIAFSQSEVKMAEIVRGAWIVEAGELRGLSRVDVESVKAFISRQKDTYRPAYGRYVVHRPRQCIMIGTTNRSTYLTDDTGNRRFIPLRTGYINLEGLRRDRDQLWAEARVYFQEGLDLWWAAKTMQALCAEQTSRLDQDDWQDTIEAYLARAGVDRVRGRSVVLDCFGITEDKFDRRLQRRLRSVMSRLGWHKKTVWIDGGAVAGYVRGASTRGGGGDIPEGGDTPEGGDADRGAENGGKSDPWADILAGVPGASTGGEDAG
jgi:hypothetical protein